MRVALLASSPEWVITAADGGVGSLAAGLLGTVAPVWASARPCSGWSCPMLVACLCLIHVKLRVVFSPSLLCSLSSRSALRPLRFFLILDCFGKPPVVRVSASLDFSAWRLQVLITLLTAAQCPVHPRSVPLTPTSSVRSFVCWSLFPGAGPFRWCPGRCCCVSCGLLSWSSFSALCGCPSSSCLQPGARPVRLQPFLCFLTSAFWVYKPPLKGHVYCGST